MSHGENAVNWRVLPHRPLTQLSERVWRLEGDLEGMPMKRVMTIAKRADGGLVVHNAIAADDPTMAAIAKLGEIRAILVLNRFHRLDAKVFQRLTTRIDGPAPHRRAGSRSSRSADSIRYR